MALVTGLGLTGRRRSERLTGLKRSVMGVLLVASLLAVVNLGGAGFSVQAEPVSVETRALYNRLEKLERDLIDVQRQTYQAGPAARPGSAGTGFGPEPSSVADLSLRLQAAEGTLRTLNGRLEELAHNLAQTQGQLRQFSEDVEFRFQELGSQELGGVGGRSLVAGNAAAAGDAGAGPVLTLPDPSARTGAAASTVGVLGTVPLSALPEEPEEDLNRRTLGAAARPETATYTPGGFAQQAGPEDTYEAAINQLKRGQFDIAEAEFANFLQRYPTHNLAGNAQYWLGETFYVRGAYRQAAEAFLTGYTTYVASSKAPDSLLKLGMTLAALGQQEQACATLGELTRRFPSASQAVTQRAQLERTRAGC